MKRALILAAGAPVWKTEFIDAANRYDLRPLGIAENSQRTPRFAARFTDLFGVDSLHDTTRVVQAARWLADTYGVDLIESFEEYWKPTEALLRQEIGLPGRGPADLSKVNSKQQMKEMFAASGAMTASSFTAETLEECLDKAQGRNFPIFAKPDRGVGAQGTLRIDSTADFSNLLQHPGNSGQFTEKYIFEDYLSGNIVTTDGLTDFSGQIVSLFHLSYPAVAEIMSGEADQCVFIAKTCPSSLVSIATRMASAYELKGEFFHFEFKAETGGYYGMDANIRLCGAYAPWLYNTAVIDSIVDRWARMLVGESLLPKLEADRCGAMICRRSEDDPFFRPYRHDHGQILHLLGAHFLSVREFEHCFRDNLNSYAYFVHAESLERLAEFRDFIQAH